MNWHTDKVPREGLASLLARIRGAGGVIASCRPDADGVHVTWTDDFAPLIESDTSRSTGRQ
jgi:hypothetical protein